MATDRPSAGGAGSSDGPGYIRGGGGVAVSRRRVAAVIAAAAALILVALAGILAVEAAQQYHRVHLLTTEGTPVVATVTDCYGIASGTGITDVGFSCHAAFWINQHHYRSPLDGTTSLYAVGASVPAVAVATDPTILYTSAAAQTMSASLTVFVAPAALLATSLTVMVAAVSLARSGSVEAVAGSAAQL